LIAARAGMGWGPARAVPEAVHSGNADAQRIVEGSATDANPAEENNELAHHRH